MPIMMDENTRKELLTLFTGVVKQQLDESQISLDKFMAAVEAKYFPPQRKYGLAGKGFGNALGAAAHDKEAVSHIGKMVIAMRKGDATTLKALSEGTDEAGGYIVPQEVFAELIGAVTGGNSVRDIVRVLPVTTLSGSVPKRLTGATLANVDATGSYGDAGATFGKVTFKVHKYGAIIPATNELVEDAALDVGQFVLDEFADAGRVTENTQVFTGVGDDNNPLGIFKATGTGFTRSAATAEGLTYDNLWKPFAKLKAAYKAKAAWLMSTDGMMAVGLVKDVNGMPIFVPNPREPGELMIFGKPVKIFDEIPTATAKTQIAIGDWLKAYYMFDRRQITMLTTNVGGTAFTSGTTDTRADERFDGKPADTAACQVVYDVPVPA